MPSLAVTLSLLAPANAATHVVPDDFPTAQAAVDAAVSGDVIQFDTTVTENFTVSAKTLTFEGVGGWVGTMSATGGANVTISGMSLSGGVTEVDPTLIQLGQYCQTLTPAAVSASNATVTVLGSSFSCYEAAIDTNGADVTISGSTFEYNYYRGAVHHVGGDLNVDTSTFRFNAGFEGGGIHAESDNANIETSEFYANTASLGGGAGLYVAATNANVSQNEFLNNWNLIWWVPGLIIDDPNDLLTEDVAGLIIGVGDGAGAYVTDPALGPAVSVRFHDNTFCGNLSDQGAGLYIDDVAGVEIVNNRFADNWAMHFGGGLYVKANSEWGPGEEAYITNNTFMKNTAGLVPPPYPQVTTVIGGGGGLAFDGTITDFRNNIVAYTPFGGGIMGIDGPDYTIGDAVTIDYNILFWNCDQLNCPNTDKNFWQNFTGDVNSIALSATNIELDPFPVYFGGGEFNCVPDAFYPEWGSPAVRSGDLSLPNPITGPGPEYAIYSDIGAYGGPEANVKDDDDDHFENIYDCNDLDISTFPGAGEICDGFDNDCDGVIDEGFDRLWYPDADGDGYGEVTTPIVDCQVQTNMVTNRDDCNDADSDIHPGEAEICDGKDNDCDFAIDGNLPFLPLWRDLDGDRFGAGGQYDGCEAQDQNAGPGVYYIIGVDGQMELQVTGYVPNHDDCNDFDLNVSPVAVEVCDGKDNDCNEVVDDSSQDGELYYTDGDHDGYGTNESGGYACAPPTPDSVNRGGDCDDFNPDLSPAAAEVCDTIDNDCDGTIDKNADNAQLLYEDLDGDGYGNPATAARDCNPGPTYTTQIGGDCDDNDALVGECSSCGCQANPTPTSAGAMAGLLGLLMAFRRRLRA